MTEDPRHGGRDGPRPFVAEDLIVAGEATRFGPDWPGLRCGAKTRAGGQCQKAALRGKCRCRLHGGLSTGPRTEAGRAAVAAAQFRHGLRSAVAQAAGRAKADVARRLRRELQTEIDALVAGGWIMRRPRAP
jgi:hypothetical protein